MICKNKTTVPVITYNQLIALLIISATIYHANLLLSVADLEGACGACAPPKIRKAYVIQR
jgi:hypothetical protein